MKTFPNIRRSECGFTLAEVAIATGIAAGVLAILTMLMGSLSRDVRRLKPYESWRRPAFVGKPDSTSTSNTSSSTTTDADDDNNSSGTTPRTNTLPDENLNPNTRPDETKVPPDPDDPDADKPKNDTSTSGNSSDAPTS